MYSCLIPQDLSAFHVRRALIKSTTGVTLFWKTSPTPCSRTITMAADPHPGTAPAQKETTQKKKTESTLTSPANQTKKPSMQEWRVGAIALEPRPSMSRNTHCHVGQEKGGKGRTLFTTSREDRRRQSRHHTFQGIFSTSTRPRLQRN